MKAFLGVLLLMCNNKRYEIYDYFSDNLFTSSKVKEIINRTRDAKILKKWVICFYIKISLLFQIIDNLNIKIY